MASLLRASGRTSRPRTPTTLPRAASARGVPRLLRAARGLVATGWRTASGATGHRAARAADLAARPVSHRHRDPPGRAHRATLLHRPRHGRRDRRDGGARRRRHALPRGHPRREGRHGAARREAAPDPGATASPSGAGAKVLGTDHDRRLERRSARTPSSPGTPRRTPCSSAFRRRSAGSAPRPPRPRAASTTGTSEAPAQPHRRHEAARMPRDTRGVRGIAFIDVAARGRRARPGAPPRRPGCTTR